MSELDRTAKPVDHTISVNSKGSSDVKESTVRGKPVAAKKAAVKKSLNANTKRKQRQRWCENFKLNGFSSSVEREKTTINDGYSLCSNAYENNKKYIITQWYWIYKCLEKFIHSEWYNVSR